MVSDQVHPWVLSGWQTSAWDHSQNLSKCHGGQGKQKKIQLGENLFHLRVIKDWRMMACENCFIGVTQSPEQSAVVHTALSRGTGLEGLQKFLPIHIIGLYGVFFLNTSFCYDRKLSLCFAIIISSKCQVSTKKFFHSITSWLQ